MSATNALSARLIGAIFLERGLITQEQLQAALAMQKESKEHLGEILVQHFGVSRIELASVLAEQWAELERTNARAGGGGAAPPSASSAQTDDEQPRTDDEQPRPDDEQPQTDDEPGEPPETDPGDEGAALPGKRPLGEIFVEQGLVTDDELDRALAEQRQSGEKLGEILVSQGSITRLQLASALAEQWTALRKIRPPSAPEPLKLVPGGGSADAPPEDVDRLREAVAALEQRLRAAESLAAREPWREEIGTATEGLEQTVAALEGRLDAVETRDEAEALTDVRTTLDELAGRVEGLASSGPTVDKDILRRVESAAEAAEAARSGLGGAFESLSLRLSDVEARVHDRSDMSELRAELAALAERVSELGAADGEGSEGDALRDEVQRLLDEVKRRTAEAPVHDPKLGERVDALAGRVDEIAGAVRGAEGGKKSSAEVKALKEALAALGAQVQELANEGKLGLDDLRNAVAEIQARPAESDLAERLSRYGAGPDHVDELRDRLGEVEGRLSELAQLSELRGAVEELAARPVGDPTLGERVDVLARELEESSGLPAQLESLRSRVNELGSVTADLAELRQAVGGLSGQAWASSEDVSDLRSEVSALGSRVDAFARQSTEVATYEQVEDLAARLRELEAATAGDDMAELRGEVAGLGQRLSAVADSSSTAVSRDELEALQARLAALAEAATSKEEHARLAERLDSVQDQGSGLDEVRRQLEALSAQAGAPAEEVSRLRAEVAALAHRLETLANRTSDAVPHERFEDLSSRVGAELDRLRRTLDELNGRPVADAGRLDALAQRVEELAATPDELDALRRDLESVSRQVGAPTDEMAHLRADVAALGQLLDALSARFAQAVSTGQIEELASRLAALEEAPRGPAAEELDELRKQLKIVSEQVGAPSEGAAELHAQVQALAQRLDALAESSAQAVSAGQIEQLASRLAALEEAATTPGATDELDEVRRELAALSSRAGAPSEDVAELRAAVEALAERFAQTASTAQIEGLTTRLAALEETPRGSAADDLDELRNQLQVVSERVGVPSEDVTELRADVAALGQRLEAVAEDSTHAASADQIEELTTRLAALEEAPRGPAAGELEELRNQLRAATEQVGAPSEDATELHTRVEALAQRLDELAARFAQAVSPAQIDELAGRLAALEEAATTPGATDELDEVRRELAALASKVGAPSEDVAHLRTELAALAVRLDTQSDRGDGDRELAERVEQLAQSVQDAAQAAEAARSQATSSAETVADDLRAELARLEERVAAVQALAASEPEDEHGPRIESVEQRLVERELREAALGEKVDEVAERLTVADELRARLDEVVERVEAHDEARAESVAKSELTKLRKDVKEKLGDLERRFEGLATSTADAQHSAVQGLQEAVEGVQAELVTQRKEVGKRVGETERETASLREQLAELRETAGERVEAQARAEADLIARMEELAGALASGAGAHADLAAALAEVRAELSMLSMRVDAPDTATTGAVESLRAELAEVVEFVRSAPKAEPDEELRARVEEIERRVETGGISADKKKKKKAKAAEPREEVEPTEAEAPAPERVATGAFLAFVPNDQGYSLHEVLGAPPAVGEPMPVTNGAAEFVVSRIGRSPLPLDRRPCVYLEFAVLETPSDSVT